MVEKIPEKRPLSREEEEKKKKDMFKEFKELENQELSKKDRADIGKILEKETGEGEEEKE